jgi:drug/metabolite transporter (DMT)-like permease
MVSSMFFDQPAQILTLRRKVAETDITTLNGTSDMSGKRAITTTSDPKASTLAVVMAFSAICLIWGSTYLAIRYAVETIPPLIMMGIRHLTAGGLLFVWARLRGTAAPLRIHWKSAVVTGAFLFLGSHGSLAWAEQRVPSGLAALLSATLPLWIVVLTRIKGRDRHLSRFVIAGLVLGFVGVAILIGPAAFHSDSSLSVLGAGAVLFGAFSWATGTIYAQHAELPSSSLLSSAMQMMSGGALLLLVGAGVGETSRMHLSAMSVRSALALGYLILFGSLIAFTAFTWLHQHVSATRNSTYAYVNPVVAVFLGWAFAGEAIGARTLLATVAILASVALVSYNAPDRKAAKHRSPRNDESAELEACGRELSTGD